MLLSVVTQAMLIMAVPCIITLLLTKSVTKSMVVLFVPLSGIEWWMGVSGTLIAFSILLPCLVGLTHLLRARHIPAGQNP